MRPSKIIPLCFFVIGIFLTLPGRLAAQEVISTNLPDASSSTRLGREMRRDGSMNTNISLPTTALGIINPGGASVLHSEPVTVTVANKNLVTNGVAISNVWPASASNLVSASMVPNEPLTFQNTQTANNNVTAGFNALFYNTTGAANSAYGVRALQANTSGFDNTANGYQALMANITGNYNTVFGANALANGTGNHNIALGAGAGRNVLSGDNNIEIDDTGRPDDSGVIRIGTSGVQNRTFIVGIYGTTVAGGAPVYVSPSGQLGTLSSSRRYKEGIEKMGGASDVLFSLEPVKFHYKAALDPKSLLQFGLLAEDVYKVDPDLVLRDDDQGIYTVRYEAVNAMLLNEFLKEHRKVQTLEQQMTSQAAELNDLKQRLEKLERGK